MKASAKKIINSLGFNLSNATSKEEVVSLIKKLKPYSVGIDLVRLGAEGDSGYLVPNDLENIEACFSPGCDNKLQFEEDCYQKGMKIFVADKTVEAKDIPDKFSFLDKFVGAISNDDLITMEEWVSKSNLKKDSDLLLQMDIEGDEFINILSMSKDLLDRCRIIVLEFHDLDKLFNKFYFNIASSVFNKLLQNHICVHIHPNNTAKNLNVSGVEIPPLAEFTFIRKDRVNSKLKAVNSFPHNLDSDCVSENQTQVLPKIWFE
ncbi:MAG: hypothetical protein AB8B78_04215 [Polaribacter sp.]